MTTYYDEDDFAPYVGQKILRFTHKRDALILELEKGTLTLAAYGDCCSESWFEHADDDGVAGGTITAFEFAEDPTKPATWDKERTEQTEFYAGVLKTTKGRVCFEMRNSSNGYYSGSIEMHYEGEGP